MILRSLPRVNSGANPMRRPLDFCGMPRSNMAVSLWQVLLGIAYTRMASIGHGSSQPLCQTTHHSRDFLHLPYGMRLQQHPDSRSCASLACSSSGPSPNSCSSRMAKSTICEVASQATSQHSNRLRTQCLLTSLIHLVLPRTFLQRRRQRSSTLRSTMAVLRCSAFSLLSLRHAYLVQSQLSQASLNLTQAKSWLLSQQLTLACHSSRRWWRQVRRCSAKIVQSSSRYELRLRSP